METTDVSSPPPPAVPQPSSNHLWRQYATANIYRCLASCKECTGYYISEILQKRFVCCCKCHHNNKKTENDFGSIITAPRFRKEST